MTGMGSLPEKEEMGREKSRGWGSVCWQWGGGAPWGMHGEGGLNPELFCYYALLLPSWIGILGNLCSRLHRGCWMAPSMVGYPHERLLRILIVPDDAA
jgi:hypothetical protein